MSIEVLGCHAALGSRRSGWSGNASASASMASASSSGAKTPPLSLIEPKPYSVTMVRACATSSSGVVAGPHRSVVPSACSPYL